jgi:hypothetical protein
MWWYGLQVTPEEMTDDEGDASISQVETADFADHSTASGESKRNGHGGRKSNGAEVSHSSSFYHLSIIYFDFHCIVIVQLSSSFYFINILI